MFENILDMGGAVMAPFNAGGILPTMVTGNVARNNKTQSRRVLVKKCEGFVVIELHKLAYLSPT